LAGARGTDRLDYITRFVEALHVGTVNVWEVPGYWTEMSPFGGTKDSGLSCKEGVIEAAKSFANVKAYSLSWL
jgi:acyl-CoA reductase-like NAD-dependent aldehyde dehydrogenase